MNEEAKEPNKEPEKIDPKDRILEEILEYIGNDTKISFISLLSNNLSTSLKNEIQEKTKKDFDLFYEDKVLPGLRNVEVQGAIHVSKMNEISAELKKVAESLHSQIVKANDMINTLKVNLQIAAEKIENTSRLLTKKVDIFEFQTLSKELSTMTPLSTFYKFQDWSQSLATKEEVYKLETEADKISDILKEKTSFEYVSNEISKVIVDFQSQLNKETNAMTRKIVKLKEVTSKNNEKIELVKQNIKQNTDILAKSITEINELIESKPWTPDIEEVYENLKKKSDITELEAVKNKLEPILSDIIKKNNEISEDLKEYSDVMARFDEVILTKSSKEDIKIINSVLKTLVAKVTIDPVLLDITNKMQSLGEDMKSNTKIVEDVNERITAYHSISATLKAQMKDHAKIVESIKNLSEAMKYKADKSDIYGIFDVVGYRDDVLSISATVEKIKELFMQAVLLQHDALNTLMPSTDPQNAKNRVRSDIIKSLDLIVRKLTNAEKGESVSKADKSRIKLSTVSSITQEGNVDEKTLTSRNNSTKHKRIFSAVGNKRFFNFM